MNNSPDILERVDAQILATSLIRRKLFDAKNEPEAMFHSVYKFLFDLSEELNFYKESIRMLFYEHDQLEQQLSRLLHQSDRQQATQTSKMFDLIHSLENKLKVIERTSFSPPQTETTIRDPNFMTKPLFEENKVDKKGDAMRVSNLLIKIYENEDHLYVIRERYGDDIVDRIVSNSIPSFELEEIESTVDEMVASSNAVKLDTSVSKKRMGMSRNKKKIFNNYTKPYNGYFDRSLMEGGESGVARSKSKSSLMSYSAEKKKMKLKTEVERNKIIDSSSSLFKEKQWDNTLEFFKSVKKENCDNIGRKITETSAGNKRKKILL